jgi:GrpB-like predicted nucleotidyltransferase (UPF0157 family)
MTQRVSVVPYNPLWPSQFEEEATKIKQALGRNCLAVHHVGSTSVPGLVAKPKIDILAVVKDMDPIYDPLGKIGYISKGEFNIPFRQSFTQRDYLNVNLHVFEEGNPEIELNLLFRDYLRSHPEARDEYAALKLDLVNKESSHARISGRFRGYNLGKDAFIKGVLEKAGFEGLCLKICTHYDEWNAARHFRQKYFFDQVPVDDPDTWTFEHQDHLHLVLYKGTQIIGYTHIQLCPEDKAALRILVIDEPFQGQGYESHFLNLCEKWLKQKGYKTLHMPS